MKPVTLRRNARIANVFPCVAPEDFDIDSLYVNDQPTDVTCNVTRTANPADTSSEKSLTVDSDCAGRGTGSVTLRDLGL